VVGAFDELGRPKAMVGAMQAAGAVAPERLMGTISEALVATAVGLVVAIPAVAGFNTLQGRVTSVLNDAETLSHLVIAHLSRRPRATQTANAQPRTESAVEIKRTDARLERPSHASAVSAE
jgi:biopolymer transport protein ExbB